MVAWKIELKTPEYPKGREIIVIANDISHIFINDSMMNYFSVLEYRPLLMHLHKRISVLYLEENSIF